MGKQSQNAPFPVAREPPLDAPRPRRRLPHLFPRQPLLRVDMPSRLMHALAQVRVLHDRQRLVELRVEGPCEATNVGVEFRRQKRS
eukprot:30991-Pelagococcus_subviridis.AAC.5